MEWKEVRVRVTENVHKAFKVACCEEGVTITKGMRKAIDKFVKEVKEKKIEEK